MLPGHGIVQKAKVNFVTVHLHWLWPLQFTSHFLNGFLQQNLRNQMAVGDNDVWGAHEDHNDDDEVCSTHFSRFAEHFPIRDGAPTCFAK